MQPSQSPSVCADDELAEMRQRRQTMAKWATEAGYDYPERKKWIHEFDVVLLLLGLM